MSWKKGRGGAIFSGGECEWERLRRSMYGKQARDVYHGSSLGNCVAGLGMVGRGCLYALRQLGLTCLGCSAARGGG